MSARRMRREALDAWQPFGWAEWLKHLGAVALLLIVWFFFLWLLMVTEPGDHRGEGAFPPPPAESR